MSMFSASSLSASDASFARQVKPLPKRRRASRADTGADRVDNLHVSLSYHHPIHTSRFHRLKQESNITPRSISAAKPPASPSRSRGVDDADGDGDYTDHLQQPNNTKKRKVPAAATADIFRRGVLALGDESKVTSDKHDHPHVNLSGGMQNVGAATSLDTLGLCTSSVFTSLQRKYSLVTSATLRLKQLLGERRKTMGAMIEKDTDPLALEFALSSIFTRLPSPHPPYSWPHRPRPRRRPRNNTPSPHPGSWISGQFTFSCPNPASTKYILAKKVAADLQIRLQAELARQTTSNVGLPLKRASKSCVEHSSGQRKKTESTSTRVASNIVPPLEETQNRARSSKTKKKKRSALANASNPHHLRNYVPSRIPQSVGCPNSTSAHGQPPNTLLGPLALKFLSATLPPRRKGRQPGSESISSCLVRPENEWICPFCEYSLFYGDKAAMQRAVKNRRKMLRRRRKARERAAAAASGTAVPPSQDVSEDEIEEDESPSDDIREVVPSVGPSQKGKPNMRQDNPGPHPGG